MIQDLGQKLRILREKRGLSQKTVADKLQISPSVVSGYEMSARTPSTEVLLKFASLYRCSVDYLLGIDSGKPDITLDVTGLTDEQVAALQLIIDSMKNEK